MNCPDWRDLDPEERETAGWEAALRHLDGGCARCWRDALAVDPSLVFRRLSAPELTPAVEADEVAAARLAVAAMRTASRVEQGARSSRGARGARGDRSGQGVSLPSSQALMRWSLAAGLAAMALVFGSSHGWREPGRVAGFPSVVARAAAGPATPEQAVSTAGETYRLSRSGATLVRPLTDQAARRWGATAATAATAAMDALPAANRSSIDGLTQPNARVYQLDGPHMSVVMIVDDKLDV